MNSVIGCSRASLLMILGFGLMPLMWDTVKAMDGINRIASIFDDNQYQYNRYPANGQYNRPDYHPPYDHVHHVGYNQYDTNNMGSNRNPYRGYGGYGDEYGRNNDYHYHWNSSSSMGSSLWLVTLSLVMFLFRWTC